MMEWTDDDVRKEIRDALKIAREDGLVKGLAEVRDMLAKLTAGPDGHTDDNPGDPKPPPAGDPKDSGDKTKKPRRSLWWGEQE